MKHPSHNIDISDFSAESTYFADFYRLFHRITMMSGRESGKVVYVTSATAGEGKTTVSTYLSITASLSSSRFYLLIDGDFHRPSVHERFGHSRSNGFADVLLGEKQLGDVINKTDFRGLHILPAGKSVSSPFQVISVQRIQEILTHMRMYYDIIFIDGPPLVPVSDSLKLAQIADGTMLVIKAGKTPREVASYAVNILRDAQIPIWGVVLNDLGEVLPYYYQPKYHDSYYYTKMQAKTLEI